MNYYFLKNIVNILKGKHGLDNDRWRGLDHRVKRMLIEDTIMDFNQAKIGRYGSLRNYRRSLLFNKLLIGTRKVILDRVVIQCPHCSEYNYRFHMGQMTKTCECCGQKLLIKGLITDHTPHMINCPKCDSGNIKKKGIQKGRQRYSCNSCWKTFYTDIPEERIENLIGIVSNEFDWTNVGTFHEIEMAGDV